MEFRILGPLEVSSDTGDVPLGGAQKRALLAVLLLHANEAVSVDRLVDELWPESPPKTAEKTVRVYVSQLRNALDDGRLERHGRGYMLRLNGEDLDAARFEALLTEGRDHLAAGEPDQAAVTLTKALALWRGPPLTDFAYEPFAQSAIARLEERRLVCLEERIEADLALARHGDVIPELEALVSDHPLRERLRGQLMLALYRSGRQAEALEVYRDGRRLLVDELGIEPGEELRRLERAILEQDASLAGPAAHERASGVPSGTVTFLFTDIEGSTQLLHQLGGGYAEMLAEHERLLRAAFAAHEGRVVDTQGDSFFVAFRTAADAVASAVDAQRDLAAGRWPHGGAVRVRMGLHTGEPRMGEQRYVGIGVHRAARIGAAGHGGQVLLSSTTRELTEEDLPPGVSIRDMGVRRLKDIDQPQRLYQLDIDGLQNEFGQLRTLDVELRRKRRRLYAGSALIGVVAAALAIPIFAFGQGGSSPGVTVKGNEVAVIDPDSNRVTGTISVGTRPGAIVAGSGSLWVANRDDQSVTRIDPVTSVTKAIPVVDTPTGLAAANGAIWVVGSNAGGPSVSLRRIDPQFNIVVAPKIQIGIVAPGGPGAAAAHGKTVWIAPSSGYLTRLDPQTGRIVKKIDPNAGPTAVAIGADAVWVADSDAGTVTRVDPTGLTTAITVGGSPSAIALDAAGVVWVANRSDDTVVRIDPSTNAVTPIPVGQAPAGIAVSPGSVWVANSGDGTVSRIDPQTGEVSEIDVGESPQSIIAAKGRIWVTVQRQTIGSTLLESSGGTAHLTTKHFDSVDPALASFFWSVQLLSATQACLVNFPDKPAPAGAKLIPEVAESLPTHSADGKTYTFTIRKGFRFSSGESVTAQTFKHAIERTLNPVMKSYWRIYLRDLVGVGAYKSGRAAHISGVVAKGNRLTLHLSAPVPDLPSQLSLPSFCAVPLETPLDPKGVGVIASAGPYHVTSYTPGESVVLERNPNYTGSRPHHLDRMELTIGATLRSADAKIEAGTADYALDGVDNGDADRLAARYGPGSPAAQNGRQRFFRNKQLAIRLFVLNTHRPLFRDVRLRQAVNYAIDRRKLAEIAGDMQPTDQYLPPGMPGFKDVDIYPFTPNVSAAKRLAGTQRRTAILYTEPRAAQIAQVIKLNLRAIGIDVVVKTPTDYGKRLARPGEPFDLAGPTSFAGLDPADLLGLPGTGFLEFFDDPSYKRKVTAASRLSGPRRYRAYGALDVYTARNAAPVVSIGNRFNLDFFSARMGCQVYSPVMGIDLAALCIRP